jgi:hypothetical protein
MDRRPPELNTVIRTFANEVEAHVAQAVLDANGIDSNLIRDDAGGMMPWLHGFIRFASSSVKRTASKRWSFSIRRPDQRSSPNQPLQ